MTMLDISAAKVLRPASMESSLDSRDRSAWCWDPEIKSQCLSDENVLMVFVCD